MTTLIRTSAEKIDDSANADGIMQKADALLLALLTQRITGFDFDIGDVSNRPGFEASFAASYETGGETITTPFKLKVTSGASLESAVDAMQTWMTANPTYWVSPLQVCYVPEIRYTAKYFVAVLYNTTLAAGANFDPADRGAGGETLYSGEVTLVQNDSAYRLNGVASSNVETDHQVMAKADGTLKNLRARALTSIGSGATVTVTVRINGVDTTLTLSFTDADTTALKADTTNDVAVSEGDLISVNFATDNGAAPAATMQGTVDLVYG